MHRCLVQPEQWAEDRIPVAEAESHRLLHVLRIRPGDTLRVFDGQGHDAVACVERDPDGALFLRRIGPTDEALPSIELTLMQAVPKGRRMDLLVEKCTELGVRTFCPVMTARGVVRPEGAARAARVARWQRIARSAARQCGVSRVPHVDPIQPLRDALEDETRPRGTFLVGSLQHAARPLGDVLAEVKTRADKRLTILIGPEGDLTDEELAWAHAHGAVPVSLGPLVLRVETAAMFCAAVVAYEFARLA